MSVSNFMAGPVPTDAASARGFICGPSIYEYEGWLFELHASCGPWPLCKDGEPRKRAGRVFWAMWGRFEDESDQGRFRVGCGCVAF